MADKLATLLRLRRLEADLARRDLALAWHLEHEQQAGLEAAVAAPGVEASKLPADRLAHAAFARWLPQAMLLVDQCHAAHGLAEEARLVAADEAASRHAAQEAVSQLQDERRQAERKIAMRKMQSGLDELAARRHGR